MDPQQLVREGQLEDALGALQDQVRKNAADPKLRIFLFQLLAVMGQWTRAANQLEVLASFDPDCKLLAHMYHPAISSELFRAEIFAGKKSPLIFGEPEAWMGQLVQANVLAGQGNYDSAQELLAQALEGAPATRGKINDRPLAWIADADSRLGPMVEVVLEGKYYWVPFCRIKRMVIEPPSDLRDLVWAPAQFVWTNQGQAAGFIPVRYPGTDTQSDGPLRLARRTTWEARGDSFNLGLGQRLWATDQEDYPILECRTLELEQETDTESPAANAEGEGA